MKMLYSAYMSAQMRAGPIHTAKGGGGCPLSPDESIDSNCRKTRGLASPGGAAPPAAVTPRRAANNLSRRNRCATGLSIRSRPNAADGDWTMGDWDGLDWRAPMLLFFRCYNFSFRCSCSVVRNQRARPRTRAVPVVGGGGAGTRGAWQEGEVEAN